MFAGEEMTLPLIADRETTLRLCARAVLEVWRGAVIQDAQTTHVYKDYRKVPFASLKEMMIYRDEAARRSWDELGADESNRNSMVHFVLAGNELAMVLDDLQSAESRRIVSAVESINEDVLALASFNSMQGAAA